MAIWASLRERRVFPWLGAYIAAGFFALEGVDQLRFDFDNDNDGAAEVNDDVILHSSAFADRFLNSKCVNSTQSSCGPDDTSAGGSKNGSSAFGSTGTYFVYEMRHPLRSGDAKDFDLAAPDTVGAFLTLSIGKGAQGNTQFPGFRQYLEIEIK